MSAINGGVCQRLLSKQFFAFAGLAAGQTQTIQAFAHAELGPFTEAVVVCRGHTLNVGAGATLTVQASADGYTFGDPTASLMTTGAMGSFVLTGPMSGPFMNVIPLSAATGLCPGRFIILTLTAVQATPTAVTITVSLSVDLVLRGGTPSTDAPHTGTPRGYELV